MEVIIPTHNFDFNSARSSPHVSPPSTPKPFGNYYFSAPTSPSRLSQVLYNSNFDDDLDNSTNNNDVDNGSIEKTTDQGFDFAFDVVSEEWETSSVSAEDLFLGGVIKPLNHPITANVESAPNIDSSKSARRVSPQPLTTDRSSHERAGRERQPNQRTRSARSLSPTRKSPSQESTVCSVLATVKGGGSNKKWSFKDLFLFRSASEGRASDKDPLKKYTEAVLRPAGSKRRGSVPVSAHERHYTVNRAVSEDMKKKTFLPYKQGILGRLAFNPAVHALANGFGFSRK